MTGFPRREATPVRSCAGGPDLQVPERGAERPRERRHIVVRPEVHKEQSRVFAPESYW